jgi:hypothetical protein
MLAIRKVSIKLYPTLKMASVKWARKLIYNFFPLKFDLSLFNSEAAEEEETRGRNGKVFNIRRKVCLSLSLVTVVI